MATDRSIIKAIWAGLFRTAATTTTIVDPIGEVAKFNTRSLSHQRNGTENAATNIAETVFGVVNRKSLVKSLKLQTIGAVANDATAYDKIIVYKRTSAGASQTVLGSWNTATAAQGATTALAAHSLSLTSTTADLTIAAGSVLTVHVGKFGNGQAIAEFSVTADLEEV